MATGRFDHLLHPLLRYDRVELPPDQNALASWRAAGEAIVDADELGNLAYLFDPNCGCNEPACLACQPPPESELILRLTEVLAKNAAVRPLFEGGLELGRLQLKLDPPKEFEGGLALDKMLQVARVNSCAGHLARLQGDPLRAATHYAVHLKAGRMLADADGSVVIFLLGVGMQNAGLQHLLQIAESGPITTELGEIFHTARALKIDAFLAVQVQRSELMQFNWPMLVELAETPAESAFERLKELFFPETTPSEPDPNDPFPDMTRGMARGEQFARHARAILFEEHPDPWDAEETLRSFGLVTASQIAELLGDATSRDEIEAELTPWHARTAAFRELLPKELGLLGSFLAYNENWKPMSDRKLRKIRDQLSVHRNALGLMIVDQMTSVGGSTLLMRPDDDSDARWERVLN